MTFPDPLPLHLAGSLLPPRHRLRQRRHDSLDRLRRAGPFNPPGDGGSAPDHDKT